MLLILALVLAGTFCVLLSSGRGWSGSGKAGAEREKQGSQDLRPGREPPRGKNRNGNGGKWQVQKLVPTSVCFVKVSKGDNWHKNLVEENPEEMQSEISLIMGE